MTENKTYYADGSIYRIERYSSDLKHGLQEAFYTNGSAKTIEPYDLGFRHGETLLYWPNGQMKRSVFLFWNSTRNRLLLGCDRSAQSHFTF
jgi:antitoxin component YwqK of YwqJK toxin-antitoxin module